MHVSFSPRYLPPSPPPPPPPPPPPSPLQEVVSDVDLVVLSDHQYVVVVDPVGKDGKPMLGTRQLRKGPDTFFLCPGEKSQNVHATWSHMMCM